VIIIVRRGRSPKEDGKEALLGGEEMTSINQADPEVEK